jgi:ubiquinone/menaquinone biosynthesis C-methylase UbiE
MVYSWGAALMEPGYRHIARQTALPTCCQAVLDAGGGDGRLAVAFARQHPHVSEIIAVDVSRDMADRARRRVERHSLQHRIRSEVGDVHNLRYEDSYFDVVVSFASMHHWRNPVRALRELDRVLKPQGLLAVMDGYDRPSFASVKDTVAAFGGSIWASIIYWMGSKDVMSYEDILRIVNRSGIGYAAISCDGPVVTIGGIKEVRRGT